MENVIGAVCATEAGMDNFLLRNRKANQYIFIESFNGMWWKIYRKCSYLQINDTFISNTGVCKSVWSFIMKIESWQQSRHG